MQKKTHHRLARHFVRKCVCLFFRMSLLFKNWNGLDQILGGSLRFFGPQAPQFRFYPKILHPILLQKPLVLPLMAYWFNLASTSFFYPPERRKSFLSFLQMQNTVSCLLQAKLFLFCILIYLAYFFKKVLCPLSVRLPACSFSATINPVKFETAVP